MKKNYKKNDKDLELLRQIIRKYIKPQPLPVEIKTAVLADRKLIRRRVFKSVGKYGAVSGLFISLYLLFKKTTAAGGGFFTSKVIIAAIASASAAAGSGYAIVKYISSAPVQEKPPVAAPQKPLVPEEKKNLKEKKYLTIKLINGDVMEAVILSYDSEKEIYTVRTKKGKIRKFEFTMIHEIGGIKE
ncbi:MAG: hypothetical protein GY754_25050 [bacterium]|nr:hypothetical protein [bacterium]